MTIDLDRSHVDRYCQQCGIPFRSPLPLLPDLCRYCAGREELTGRRRYITCRTVAGRLQWSLIVDGETVPAGDRLADVLTVAGRRFGREAALAIFDADRGTWIDEGEAAGRLAASWR